MEIFRLWPTTKTVEVTPSFKKGCKMLPTNYHPVSLIFIVCKLLETIVKEHIMNHFSVKSFDLIVLPRCLLFELALTYSSGLHRGFFKLQEAMSDHLI